MTEIPITVIGEPVSPYTHHPAEDYVWVLTHEDSRDFGVYNSKEMAQAGASTMATLLGLLNDQDKWEAKDYGTELVYQSLGNVLHIKPFLLNETKCASVLRRYTGWYANKAVQQQYKNVQPPANDSTASG